MKQNFLYFEFYFESETGAYSKRAMIVFFLHNKMLKNKNTKKTLKND